MKIACSCLVMVLLMSGCVTTGKVDQMIDSKVVPQIEQINAQVADQAVASGATLGDMKSFIYRLGTTLDEDAKKAHAGVNGLKSQVSNTQSDVTALEGAVDELESSLSGLSGTVNSLQNIVETLMVSMLEFKTADAATKTADLAISGSE